MDPNEALRRLRAALHPDSLDGTKTCLEDARDAFEALDGWLSRDGFLPDDWQPEKDKTGGKA